MDAATLRALIDNNAYICRLPNGDYAPWSQQSGSAGEQFSLQDTAQLDPRLPAMLVDAFNDRYAVHRGILPLNPVRKALKGWEEPPVTKLQGFNAQNTQNGVVTFPVHSLIRASESAILGFQHLYVVTMTERMTDEGILYAHNFPHAGFHVEESALNKAFPEWRKRLEVARALDLSPRDMAEMVFTEGKLSMYVDMDNVTFD